MAFKIGTFNLNNLFSRYNFELRADVPGLKEGKVEFTKVQKVVHGLSGRSVNYEGMALHRKDPADRQLVAERIRQMDLDVLAVQEVEDIDTLQYFARFELKTPIYPYLLLIEGNDPRLIDVAILSKYPIGGATSWQKAVHPDAPHELVFSRDLLQVDILSADRKHKILTAFVNHLKSHYVPFNENQTAGGRAADTKRRQQAEVAAMIIGQQMSGQDPYVVLGDMNDGIDSEFLKPLIHSPKLRLVNGLAKPMETSPTPKNDSPPKTTAWTDRFKAPNKPADYELFDQIWLSPALAHKQTGAFINRRTKLAGDGSDHDPGWVTLDL